MAETNGVTAVTMRPPPRVQSSAPPKTAQIKGQAFQVLNLQGKPYAPVHQRVESAMKMGGYTVVSCEFKEIFGKQVCEVWIELPTGQRFPGTAELRKNFDRPLEDAQTSAIGRALGLAGFNIETAIATNEDMQGVLDAQHATVVEAVPAQLSTPAYASLSTEDLAKDCAARAKALGMDAVAYKGVIAGATGKCEKLIRADWLTVAATLDDLETADAADIPQEVPDVAS